MSGSAYELLKIIKEHTAQDGYAGPQVGVVRGVNPLAITLGTHIKLQPRHLVMAQGVGVLEPGDQVILLPSANGQKYFVIDKVVR